MDEAKVKEWLAIAEGNGACEQVGEGYFYYGSERACKNLYKHYNGGLCEFSPRYQFWFFTIKSELA